MHIHMMRRGVAITVLALVYYIAARFSLLLALPPGYAAPIWPAAGIALAAVLLFGPRVAPGIWLGSFLANAPISFDAGSTALLVNSLLLPAGLGVGAALEAIVGALLIRAGRMYGYSANELLGRSITTLIPPGLAGEMAAIQQRLERGERIAHLDTVRVRKDGRLIDISLTSSPIRDARGAVIGVSAIARDISERKRGEAALPERDARIRRLVDADIIGIFIGDLGGAICEANDAFLAICGYTRFPDARRRYGDVPCQGNGACQLSVLYRCAQPGRAAAPRRGQPGAPGPGAR